MANCSFFFLLYIHQVGYVIGDVYLSLCDSKFVHQTYAQVADVLVPGIFQLIRLREFISWLYKIILKLESTRTVETSENLGFYFVSTI